MPQAKASWLSTLAGCGRAARAATSEWASPAMPTGTAIQSVASGYLTALAWPLYLGMADRTERGLVRRDPPELEPPPLGRHIRPDDAGVIQRVHVLRGRRELHELGGSPSLSVHR